MMPRARLLSLALIAGAVLFPGTAAAQGAVGSGPLTSTLTETEPTSGILNLGSLKLAPGITINQIGVDSNVFNQANDPKEDFIASVKPDLAAFLRLRFMQVSAYGGGDFSYFRTYDTENSAGYAGRARVDFLFSRFFPFVGFGETKTRERAGSEIDVRANNVLREQSGGVGYRWSETGALYLSVVNTKTKYEAAFEDGVDLSQSLNRYSEDFGAGLRTALSPLTTLTLRAGYQQDIFQALPARNSNRRYLSGVFSFAPQATFTGSATVGYLDFRPADPKVEPFRGLTASLALSYPILEIIRINAIYSRSLEYSFDVSEAYYLSNRYSLALTQRILGAVDAQVVGSRTFSNYGQRETAPPRTDSHDVLNGSLGYNLRNRTRIALNYEYSRRKSLIALNNFEGRRIYLSWTYAF